MLQHLTWVSQLEIIHICIDYGKILTNRRRFLFRFSDLCHKTSQNLPLLSESTGSIITSICSKPRQFLQFRNQCLALRHNYTAINLRDCSFRITIIPPRHQLCQYELERKIPWDRNCALSTSSKLLSRRIHYGSISKNLRHQVWTLIPQSRVQVNRREHKDKHLKP